MLIFDANKSENEELDLAPEKPRDKCIKEGHPYAHFYKYGCDCCEAVERMLGLALKKRQIVCERKGIDPEIKGHIPNLSEEGKEALRRYLVVKATCKNFEEYKKRCGDPVNSNPWEDAFRWYLEDIENGYPRATSICEHCDWIAFYKWAGKTPCMLCPFAFNGVPISQKKLVSMTTDMLREGILPYFYSFVNIFETFPYDPNGLYDASEFYDSSDPYDPYDVSHWRDPGWYELCWYGPDDEQ